MGAHRSHTSSSTPSLATRGVFVAAAAFALVSGGAGMALAGEAPSDAGHSKSDDHGKQDHHGQGDCRISVVDPTVEAADAAANEVTGDATKPVLEAGDKVYDPIHDAVCKPVDEVVDTVTHGDDDAAPQASDVTSKLPA